MYLNLSQVYYLCRSFLLLLQQFFRLDYQFDDHLFHTAAKLIEYLTIEESSNRQSKLLEKIMNC
jgi:hypothetical protein